MNFKVLFLLLGVPVLIGLVIVYVHIRLWKQLRAKDKVITDVKSELNEKIDIIDAMQECIDSQDELINELKKRI